MQTSANTLTSPVPVIRVGPDAVMIAGPTLVAVAITGGFGVVWFAAIKTVAGTVTRALFELARLTVTPPEAPAR